VNSLKSPDVPYGAHVAPGGGAALKGAWLHYVIGVKGKRGLMLVDAMFAGAVDELGSFAFVPLRIGVNCHLEQRSITTNPLPRTDYLPGKTPGRCGFGSLALKYPRHYASSKPKGSGEAGRSSRSENEHEHRD
jgi:hypothetical protein